MIEKTFGTTISKKRRSKKLTQKELAEILHVSDKAVSRWETDASLPDIDMIQTIAIVLELEFEELLKFKVLEKDEVTLNTIVKEYEKKTKNIKSKYRKILFLVVIFSLFLLLLLFFATTYNKFKLYDICIIGDKFHTTKGVFIDTNIQNYFYFGSILLEEDIDISDSSIDILILDNKKEKILKHYDNVYKNIQFELDNSYMKIYDINNDFDKMFIRITNNKTKEEYIGQINFTLRFNNDKLFYLKENNKKLKESKTNDNEIITKLEKLGFKKKNNNEYVNKKENLYYYIDNSKLVYYFIDNNKSISNKYMYYYKLQKLEVLITSKNKNVDAVIEKYIYNIKTKEINCIVGQCVDYNEILKVLDKYIKYLE